MVKSVGLARLRGIDSVRDYSARSGTTPYNIIYLIM